MEFAPRVVAYAPDGSLLIGSGVPETSTTSSPERARLVVLGTDGRLEHGPDPEGLDVSSIAIDPVTGSIAAVGANDDRVLLWDRSADGQEDLPRAPGPLGRLAWAPDGSRLLGVSPSHGVLAHDGTDWTAFDLP
ncbi:hypothetical protein [Brachybacterium saurashtrense]|uniref:WD40 repeat domain-containing protein n=1 Tax=Brachybacterium saurashtrense TaxID=556288 RepID=A0A345YQA3_9MICO|nr:hypothetical protein [Brachybacterium saurashtrense]AXK46105.1 hypothetical protein DWV08_11130 [Brachybacterium saurashtrense]RRR23845.1 hypothetical protein DXU92_02880 [Brachybacterium saurashtrense]